ncbi:MAG: hypothetical protein JW797_09185 [Bradymonadales bacterium]|nr:hypothetical protein [Bradymonadales bacterium]
MRRHVIIYEELKKLRESQRKRWEPIPLQLPLEIEYWPNSGSRKEESEEEEPSRVVIIDMNDYREIAP